MAKMVMFAKIDEESQVCIEIATWKDDTVPTTDTVISLPNTMTGAPEMTNWACGARTFLVMGNNETTVQLVTVPMDEVSQEFLEEQLMRNSDEAPDEADKC